MSRADPLPERPPFILRTGLLTPLAAGGTRHLPDALVGVDAAGRLERLEPWPSDAPLERYVDRTGMLALPGLVDLHVHLPQLPNAGLGAGMRLLEWLERYIFPLERAFDRETAERLAPEAYRAFARAGTTTIVAYGALWHDSLDACFAAAERHGIRAVIGKVMMDRITYDPQIRPQEILPVSLRQSAELCRTWHGRDAGRLRYAFTPRFAVSCSAEMLAESARLATETGAYWQTHLAEDRGEIAEVKSLFPEARDYLDVYQSAGGLAPNAILAHAIHLSDDAVARLAASGAAVAHCPASNLFLAAGMMPLAQYRGANIRVGLGSDVAAGPDLSLFSVMRAGAYTHNALALMDGPGPRSDVLDPLDWLRLGSLEGARALGMGDEIGSLEEGKEADMILVDPAPTAPIPGSVPTDPRELMSRLIFRSHPEMVRAAWVRGRMLPA